MNHLLRVSALVLVTLALVGGYFPSGESPCSCGSAAFAQDAATAANASAAAALTGEVFVASPGAELVASPAVAVATEAVTAASETTVQGADAPKTLVASEAAPAVQGPLPKMIDLGADKCIPCKKMAPILEEAKKLYEGKAEVVFIDVWKNRDAGTPYGIRIIPTQVFFDASGKEVFRHEGFLPMEDIQKQFESMGVTLPGK